MEYIIQNGRFTLTADTYGAELHSLKDQEGRELIWQAGAIWPKHAPVCCPWCGPMQDGWFIDEGKEYRDAACRHGFVREMEHTLLQAEPEQLTFRLDWPGDSARWPWAFSVETVHALTETGMTTTCTVENRTERPMPLQFGFHPAFTCPFLPGTKATDYLVRFESGRVIDLVLDIFDNDSIRYTDVGQWARLEHRETGKYIQVDTGNFAYVLLWSKPGIPGFVCIEPWSGHENDSHIPLERPGAKLLNPGDKRSWVLAVTVQLQ